jgi:hypothetical protein
VRSVHGPLEPVCLSEAPHNPTAAMVDRHAPALWKAVYNGDLGLAQRLLEDDHVDVDGLGCLHKQGDEENEAETTPLHTAVRRTNWVCLEGTGITGKKDGTEIVRLLLRHGADPMFKDSNDFSVLNAAASGGVSCSPSTLTDNVTMLLQKGADVNQANERGETPIHNAAFYGYAPVVTVLLEHGASLLLRTRADLTAQGMALAAQSGDSHQEVLEVLEAAMNRDKCTAFAMGLHPRLGVNSLVLMLDPAMLRMVASGPGFG